ncbi:MAG: RagB/SusD family nutrient uptake outer membrane protein [Chitinophaga sp.]|uniref:RagB/SusD family nutrient uptake outer membrane protein n=1 Tax=Chitinophaga sp. TaxID=1869181 RepID=UPI0025BEC9A4|nr:RagB/SusD family nutrient uptake outer membrane protein [Chitinophaga sp.]MBV8255868.1 RagB/SusD family nutrient uptake outer membrane protein [Chitinophaga sp.]
MKKLFYIILCGATLTGASSCKKYLDIVPRGQKIPQTLEDYKALMETKNSHIVDMSNQSNIANEWGFMQSQILSTNLSNINYLWQESQDRMQYLQTDMGYNWSYSGIFNYNVIINHLPTATTGTPEIKAQLIAQAKVMRAIQYFYLVSSYAKTYDPATAPTDPGVIINTSDDMEQKLTQSSVKSVYNFIISELNAAIPVLPDMGINPMFPGKGTAYALLSRVYMFQRDFTQAEAMADKALAINSQLFDYVQYYYDNKALADGTSPSINVPKYEFKNPENYIFNYGGQMAQMQGFYISLIKAADSTQYDRGDARLKINFAARTIGGEVILSYRRFDDANVGGIRTPEMYYYKAECLARAGKISESMDVLNQVRVKRIIKEFYTPVTATTEADAIALIRREMRCEYRGYGGWYLDYRRFNNDPKYKATLTKTEYGTNYSISPESHLWIIPFSQTAIAYGEGRLTQNSK